MKSSTLATSVILVLYLSNISCHPSRKEDTSKIAKEANKENFDVRSKEKDADFIVEIVAWNYEEIKLAQLAQTKSTNESIIIIADSLQSEHLTLVNELKGFANKNGISIPLEEDKTAKIKLEHLSSTENKSFDKKWCSETIVNHENNIQKFEDRWNQTENDELRDLINTTLPLLNSHLEMLKAQEEKYK